MDANEMRKLKQANQQPTELYKEGLESILQVIQEMACEGLDYLVTPYVFTVTEAQEICGKLIEKGFVVHALQSDDAVALEIDWS